MAVGGPRDLWGVWFDVVCQSAQTPSPSSCLAFTIQYSMTGREFCVLRVIVIGFCMGCGMNRNSGNREDLLTTVYIGL